MARPYEIGVEFPLPWLVEEDWTYEVKDATGKTIASSPYGVVAHQIVAQAAERAKPEAGDLPKPTWRMLVERLYRLTRSSAPPQFSNKVERAGGIEYTRERARRRLRKAIALAYARGFNAGGAFVEAEQKAKQAESRDVG